MRIKPFLLFYILCRLVCHAQPYSPFAVQERVTPLGTNVSPKTSVQLPFDGQASIITSKFGSSGSGSSTVTSIPGIRYWWVSSDLTLNANVTSWVDRIVGSVYTNGASSLQPTNATTGVGFKGSTSLTNTVPFSFTSGSPATGPFTVFAIVRPHVSTASLGAILGAPDQARGLYVDFTPEFKVFGGNGNFNPLTGTIQNDKVMDIAFSGASNVANDTFYTNGVSFTSGAAFDGSQFGTVLGKDIGADFYIGSEIELIFYTNVVSAANILVLHQYATNTYSSLTWQ